ncbi:MAG: hypothetical protein ACRDQB_13730, partial [Thermocrispum sp.]
MLTDKDRPAGSGGPDENPRGSDGSSDSAGSGGSAGSGRSAGSGGLGGSGGWPPADGSDGDVAELAQE